MQKGQNIGHSIEHKQVQSKNNLANFDDFVLEKSIFSNIFEKDIKRVYIYKKAERLGKAIHLITPAFVESVSLKNRLDTLAIGLVDAALLSPGSSRTVLARELLALSSVLSIARVSGLLSAMNTDLITREAHLLLQEIAAYEEPRILLDEVSTLSSIARDARAPVAQVKRASTEKRSIRDIKDTDKGHINDRREAIVSVIKNKGTAHIKDISTLIRGVSEKTIQRELLSLIATGVVVKKGERRWSTYSLAGL